jgi:hypothetical protein
MRSLVISNCIKSTRFYLTQKTRGIFTNPVQRGCNKPIVIANAKGFQVIFIVYSIYVFYGNKEQLMPLPLRWLSVSSLLENSPEIPVLLQLKSAATCCPYRLGKHQARPGLLAHIAKIHSVRTFHFMRMGTHTNLLTVQIIIVISAGMMFPVPVLWK